MNRITRVAVVKSSHALSSHLFFALIHLTKFAHNSTFSKSVDRKLRHEFFAYKNLFL